MSRARSAFEMEDDQASKESHQASEGHPHEGLHWLMAQSSRFHAVGIACDWIPNQSLITFCDGKGRVTKIKAAIKIEGMKQKDLGLCTTHIQESWDRTGTAFPTTRPSRRGATFQEFWPWSSYNHPWLASCLTAFLMFDCIFSQMHFVCKNRMAKVLYVCGGFMCFFCLVAMLPNYFLAP